MITITLTDADAEAYINMQAAVKLAAGTVEEKEPYQYIPGEQPEDFGLEPAPSVELTAAEKKKAAAAEKRKAAAAKKAELKLVEAEPEVVEETAAEHDVDALREQFEALVIRDYDKAVELIDALEVENFSQAIGAGLEAEMAAALAAAS